MPVSPRLRCCSPRVLGFLAALTACGGPTGWAAPSPPDLPGDEAESYPERNRWQYIVIHHSASTSGNAAVFDRAHRARGWDGVAYHFVIGNGGGAVDGRAETTARWWQQKHGAHAGRLARPAEDERNAFNEFGIGICLVGNFEHQSPTSAQLTTLAQLLDRLRSRFDIDPERIVGHGHVKGTACPGRRFPWTQLFSMLELPTPRHLVRHGPNPTSDRCPWCLDRLAAARQTEAE